LTKVVADLDEDNNLVSESDNHVDPLQFMSMTKLRGNDKNQCGYKCIASPTVNATDCVYILEMNASNNSGMVQPMVVTYALKMVSKSRLTQLSIQSVRWNVENMTELEHINPNGTVKSIQTWARIAFRDSDTGAIDTTQQRAFEVIVTAFVRTFHDEADKNESLGVTGTVDPYSRNKYVQLCRQLNC